MKKVRKTTNKTAAYLWMLSLTMVAVLVLSGSSFALCKANQTTLRKKAETQRNPVSVSAIEPNTCLKNTSGGHNIYRIVNTAYNNPAYIVIDKDMPNAHIQLFNSDLHAIDETTPETGVDGSLILEIPMSDENGKYYFVDISHPKKSSDRQYPVMYIADPERSLFGTQHYNIGHTVHLSTKGDFQNNIDGSVENFDATKGFYAFMVDRSDYYNLDFSATGECNYSFIINEINNPLKVVHASSGTLYPETPDRERIYLEEGVAYHIFYNAQIDQGGALEFSINSTLHPNLKG